MEIIKIRGLNKYYGEKETEIRVLKGINLDIIEGEFLVIVGESGGGKSTLLNIIGGLDRGTSGTVTFNNVDISKFTEEELTEFRCKNVGFVFQFYNLIPSLTALENVEISSELTKNPLNSYELLDKVGLKGKEDSFPAKLSGGEQQRVAICRALSKNPRVILCDEPTGALDFETGVKILELLSKMNRDYKKTIVLITHNQPIAEIADRVVRIRSGNIVDIKVNKQKKHICEVKW